MPPSAHHKNLIQLLPVNVKHERGRSAPPPLKEIFRVFWVLTEDLRVYSTLIYTDDG